MSATTTQRPNVIPEVVIGTQTWSLRNYDFGGIDVNDDFTNVSDYGKLYTWEEAVAIDVDGWHLPTNAEWDTLITYLGGTGVAGGKMKEAGLSHWSSPNTGATNSSGFTALPAGDQISQITWDAYLWSATEYDGSNAYVYQLSASTDDIAQGYNTKALSKYSVRLIKD